MEAVSFKTHGRRVRDFLDYEHQPTCIMLNNFPLKCMKMKKIGPRRECPSLVPPPPPGSNKKESFHVRTISTACQQSGEANVFNPVGGGPYPSPTPVQNPTIQGPSATRQSQLRPHYAGTSSDMFKLVS